MSHTAKLHTTEALKIQEIMYNKTFIQVHG